MSRRYISIAEAAEYLKISDRTVRRLIADGELMGYSIGRGHRMLRVDLDEIDEKLMRPIGFHWNDPSAKPANASARASRIGQPRLRDLTSRPPSRTPLSASRGDRRCGASAVMAMGLTECGPLTDLASTRPTRGLSAGRANAWSLSRTSSSLGANDDPKG